MPRYCFALDLKDDEALISDYEAYHKNVWPEVLESIKESGITAMEIYRAGNRLFMIMETTDAFSFERKKEMDTANQKVQEWEKLMLQFQQQLPFAGAGEKWVIMKNVFSL